VKVASQVSELLGPKRSGRRCIEPLACDGGAVRFSICLQNRRVGGGRPDCPRLTDGSCAAMGRGGKSVADWCVVRPAPRAVEVSSSVPVRTRINNRVEKSDLYSR
jgi:hypothetical protein